MSSQYCPQCGTARLGAFRFCRTCRFDFDSEATIAQESPPPPPPVVMAPAPLPSVQTTSVPAPVVAGGSTVAGASRITKRRVIVGSIVALVAIGAIGSAAGAPTNPAATRSQSPSAGLGVAKLTQAPTNRPTSTASPTVTPEPTPEATPDPTAEPTPAPTIAPITYAKLTSREWSKVVKAPDNYAGKGYQVWACISQFDAATGTDSFRAQASYAKQEYWYTDGANTLFSGTTDQLADFVQDDVVFMKVLSLGSFSYDTQIGGNTTVPLFEVVSISRKGSCA